MKFLANIWSALYRKLPALYLTRRAVLLILAITGMFLLGFGWPWLFPAGQMLLGLLVVGVVAEVTMLYSIRQPFSGERILEEKLSNGDYNPLIIKLQCVYPFSTLVTVIDEFPVQLQLRGQYFELGRNRPAFKRDITYEIRPVNRGDYEFGDLHILVSSVLGLVQRKVTLPAAQTVPVYPSFIQLRKFSFYTIHDRLDELGVKKIRKLGANNEFEQIREYVQGDDFRRINWAATARKNTLMVNEYQEEKAQQVYCVLDSGRHMQMPFGGLSLLEYAVNATLVMLGVAHAKGDKPGLLSFAKKVDFYLPAHSKTGQLNRIAEGLYRVVPQSYEPDFLRLYKHVKTNIRKRSLLLLFTNFDTLPGLKRQLPYLRALARQHLLCVVIFENTEVSRVAQRSVNSLAAAYEQTVAEKYSLEKRQIVAELTRAGIYSIYTAPENLTVDTINKYLYFKARGVI